VATPETVTAWIERAQERTFKNLREEVDAADLLVRLRRARPQPPPDDDTMQGYFEIERLVLSGELLTERGLIRGESLRHLFERTLPDAGGQISGDAPSSGREKPSSERAHGRVTFRWHVSAPTARFWRALERIFKRVGHQIGWFTGFVRFVGENFCRVWLPVMRHARLTQSGQERAYFPVYRRDGFRCSSPVCCRRDITPHHLRFRAFGGDDDSENLTTLCVWCHLRGVHGGRLRVAPPASKMHWHIGPQGRLQVIGRTRIAS
jgi:hypothetical protein